MVDAACGPLDDRARRKLEQLAAGVKEGSFGRLNIDDRDYFLHRLPGGVWRLTTTSVALTPSGSSFAWAAPLWALLMAGADTPAARSELAWSMVAKLPCGPCKAGWKEALKGLTEERIATPEAFRRWVWGERQRIAAAKGLAVWEYPA